MNYWKFALVIITFAGLGWVGLFVGVYFLWHLNKLEKKINEH